jgi:hypothetical protein
MPVDFQVIYPQESVVLTRVTAKRTTVGQLVLDILGRDFRAVDEVLVNGMPSPDIIVLSKTRLLAQVPETLRNDRLVTVDVLTKQLTITPRSLIKFRIGNTPGKVKGVMRLMQLFLKILFTTPGKDVFEPKLGGAALKNLGSTFGQDEGAGIVSDFVVAVDNTQRQVIAIQGRNASIPRDERLLSAKVIRAGFNKSEGALNVSIELTSQAGQAVTANVVA